MPRTKAGRPSFFILQHVNWLVAQPKVAPHNWPVGQALAYEYPLDIEPLLHRPRKLYEMSTPHLASLQKAKGAAGDLPGPLWGYRLDQDRSLLGGALSEGGNLYAWLRDTLALPQDEDLDAALASMPPAAPDLLFLPVLAGERRSCGPVLRVWRSGWTRSIRLSGLCCRGSRILLPAAARC